MFQYFYHQRLRKAVALFGALFNNIFVIRTDSSGKTISQVKVPLSYAPKDKYLERIRANPDLDNDTMLALKLPRMSFEITSINYNPERKIAKLNQYTTAYSDGARKNKFYSPAPYEISFQLNVYAKQQDDALQIVEQILPYFNPQYSLTINPFKDISTDIKEDVPITIQNVSFTDDFEGTVESRRTIIYTLDFSMPANFYGPINTSEVIRKATIDTFEFDTQDKLQQSILRAEPFDINLESAQEFGFNEIVEKDIFESFDPDSDKNPTRFIPSPVADDMIPGDSFNEPSIEWETVTSKIGLEEAKIMRWYELDSNWIMPPKLDSVLDSMLAGIFDRVYARTPFTVDSELENDFVDILTTIKYYDANFEANYDNELIKYELDTDQTLSLTDIINKKDSLNINYGIVQTIGELLRTSLYSDSDLIINPQTRDWLDVDSDGLLLD